MSKGKDTTKLVQEKMREKGAHISLAEAAIIKNAVFDSLFEQISNGETVTIPNVGIFSSTLRSFDNNLSIDSGKRIQRFTVRFKTSSKLKEKLNVEIKKETP